MLPDLERLIELLADQGVRFVLIGGVAMVLHGSAHVTQDLDLCYGRDPHNLQALARALSESHPRLRGAPADLPFRWDARTLQIGNNFTLQTDIGDVDLLGDVAGVDSFEALWSRAVVMQLGRVEVRVASLDDLIAMKRAAGREKDRGHILELQELKRLLESEHS
ncbi:MAG: nucleotidyltransferase [Candidatus Xenobia bacterium]